MWKFYWMGKCNDLFIKSIKINNIKNEDIIKLVDPIGGPTICINEYLDSSNGVLYVNQIEHIEDKNQFIIYTKRRN